MRILVGVALLCSASRAGLAQPFSDPTSPRDVAGTTRIPVAAPDDEVLDGLDTHGREAPPAAISIEHPIDPATYVCGPGDVFELNFWGRQNFRLRLVADPEGRAFISKVGYVDVAGKTLSAVRTQVTKKVRGNYPGLQFDLTLLAPRKFLVHVVENVKSPGTYTAQPIERVSAVLARAGGITNGSRRRISIRRRNGTELRADLMLFELTGDTAHNPYVLDGDTIRVPFPDTKVTIGGAVRRPGDYELVASKDLRELVELAGGTTSGVARSLPVRVIRRNDRQQEVTLELPFDGDAMPNTALRDDDNVVIRGATELQRSVLLIGAVTDGETLDAAATSKRLPFVEGDTVLSLLDRAGGIRAPGDLSRAYLARPRSGKEPEIIPVDLDALLVRRDFSADRSIAMGDTIVVPPMRYSILVEGAVSRAGLYTFNPSFGVAEYIAHAGGRTRSARDLDEVKLIKPSGSIVEYRGGLKLQPGDAILVPERNFTRPEIVQIAIAAAGLVLSGVAITIAATR